MKEKQIIHFIILSVITLLILAGTIVHIVSFLGFGIAIIYMWFLSDFENVEILFYLLPIAMIFKNNPRGTSFFTYLELCIVIFNFIKQKRSFNSVLLGYITLFSAYIVGMQFANFGFNLTLSLKLIAGFFILITITEMDMKEHYTGIFLHYIGGMIVSSIIAFFGKETFNLSVYFESQEMVIIDGEFIERFSGLYSDPNYYTINLLLAFCLIIILYYFKKLPAYISICLAAILFFFASQTQSKSALLSLSIPAFFLLYMFHKTNNQTMIIIFCFLISVFVMLLFSNKLPMFSNIVYRLKSASGAAELTTGRSTLWGNYCEYILRNPRVLIFGKSVLTSRMEGSLAPHNTYIDLIFQLGIVGTFALFGLLNAIARMIKPVKVSCALNYSILVCMAVMYFCISELQAYETPFHIYLCLFVQHIDFEERTRRE